MLVTEIGGDAVSDAKETNIVNSLSGKIAGVSIRQATRWGGLPILLFVVLHLYW